MIYSASRRTDMAAFHPDALAGRVARSRRLEALVVWTKDVRNLVRHPGLADVLERFPTLVQFTATGLAGTVWEPRVPPLERQIRELETLAASLPRGAILWRFDPLLPTPDLDERFDRARSLLEQATGNVDGVTVSFPDPYPHAVRRAAAAGLAWPRPDNARKQQIITRLAARFPGVERPVRLCCEPGLLDHEGAAMARCIDGELLERLYGMELKSLEKDPGQRKACGCVTSTDIGTYAMPCGHGCLYCYANRGE